MYDDIVASTEPNLYYQPNPRKHNHHVSHSSLGYAHIQREADHSVNEEMED